MAPRSLAALKLTAALVLVLVPACDARSQSPETCTLRVLTYNIHHGEGVDGRFDYRRLANIISEVEPDLVALQEVDRKTKRASGVDQACRLAELTGMNCAYGRAMHYSGGEYGEAILSRFPIKRSWVHALPFRYGQEPRAALVVEVEPSRGIPRLHFAGTHFCHQSGETRLEQAAHLNAVLAQSGDDVPVLLAGDLNARPKSKPIASLLEGGWVDAVAPQSRIDYIMYRRRDPWRVVQATVVPEDVASDHRPVVVDFQWLRESK